MNEPRDGNSVMLALSGGVTATDGLDTIEDVASPSLAGPTIRVGDSTVGSG